jgi:hypothetical protein
MKVERGHFPTANHSRPNLRQIYERTAALRLELRLLVHLLVVSATAPGIVEREWRVACGECPQAVPREQSSPSKEAAPEPIRPGPVTGRASDCMPRNPGPRPWVGHPLTPRGGVSVPECEAVDVYRLGQPRSF